MTWDPVGLGDPRPSGGRGKGGKQGRLAKGPRRIPRGVATAVQAMALEGVPQHEIVTSMGVSRWYVKRLTETVQAMDLDQVAILRKRLPQQLTVLAAGAADRAIEAVAANEPGNATKWTFATKLATESGRFAAPAADSPGEQLLQFIAALGQAGGGALIVAPTPTPDPELTGGDALALPDPTVIDSEVPA
jgi:hypothetical protein